MGHVFEMLFNIFPGVSQIRPLDMFPTSPGNSWVTLDPSHYGPIDSIRNWCLQTPDSRKLVVMWVVPLLTMTDEQSGSHFEQVFRTVVLAHMFPRKSDAI